MSSVNLALIGCGQLGRVHLACAEKIPAARFIAYCDKVDGAAESLLNERGGEYATTDVDRVLGDKRIQAVYICTRHDSHAPLAVAAAKAEKHIFIEKPLALTIDDCDAVAKVVRRAGVYLMPAFKMRYYPLIQKAREFIPCPQVLVVQMMDSRWSDDGWGQDSTQGGANVHSQGCHMTDVLRFLARSEPRRVWAAGGTMTHPGHPCIDQCVASIQFENGHVASWIQGDAALGKFTSKFFVELFGDGKSVQLYDRFTKATFSDSERTWVEERGEEEGFALENREFVDALLHNRTPAITAHDGLQATRLVLAADRAIRTGQVHEL